MTREEKNQLIDSIADQLANNTNIYLADISELDSENTTKLRALCFKKQIHLQVVKKTLLKKAMEKADREFESLYEILTGPTSLMFSEIGSEPAKLIKEFRKKSDKPILKGAYIEDVTYIGDDQVDFLASIKSKNELIADLVALLQSPLRNVMSQLNSGSNIITGVLQTMSERTEN